VGTSGNWGAGFGQIAEEMVWEKLRALRAGADLATKRLL